jgi:hypothetical protein
MKPNEPWNSRKRHLKKEGLSKRKRQSFWKGTRAISKHYPRSFQRLCDFTLVKLAQRKETSRWAPSSSISLDWKEIQTYRELTTIIMVCLQLFHCVAPPDGLDRGFAVARLHCHLLRRIKTFCRATPIIKTLEDMGYVMNSWTSDHGSVN